MAMAQIQIVAPVNAPTPTWDPASFDPQPYARTSLFLVPSCIFWKLKEVYHQNEVFNQRLRFVVCVLIFFEFPNLVFRSSSPSTVPESFRRDGLMLDAGGHQPREDAPERALARVSSGWFAGPGVPGAGTGVERNGLLTSGFPPGSLRVMVS